MVPLDEARIDQAVASEATPSFELGTDAALGANHGHEIARAGTTYRGNQLNKQAGLKGLRASIELDIRSYWHAATLSRHSDKIQERLPLPNEPSTIAKQRHAGPGNEARPVRWPQRAWTPTGAGHKDTLEEGRICVRRLRFGRHNK
jgi:hypothetical protein